MQSTVTFQPTSVRTESIDRVGRLAFIDGDLVAVLVRLDAPGHLPTQRGRWFLEAGFGPCGRNTVPCFDDLESARSWIDDQVGIPARAPSRPALRLVSAAGD